MRLSEHFFGAPICKCNLNYTLAWFFLLLGYSFVISIVLVNPLELKYGEDKNVIQFILCIAGCFLVSIFSEITPFLSLFFSIMQPFSIYILLLFFLRFSSTLKFSSS